MVHQIFLKQKHEQLNMQTRKYLRNLRLQQKHLMLSIKTFPKLHVLGLLEHLILQLNHKQSQLLQLKELTKLVIEIKKNRDPDRIDTKKIQ